MDTMNVLRPPLQSASPYGPIQGSTLAGGGISKRGLWNIIGGLSLLSFLIYNGYIFRRGAGIAYPGVSIRETDPARLQLAKLGVFTPTRMIAPRKERTACPHWQAMGCLGDSLEKLCEGDTKAAELLKPTAQESVWMCCCPSPYEPCEASQRDKTCHNAMISLFDPLIEMEKVPTAQEAVVAILRLRQQLRQTEGIWGSCLNAISAEDQLLGRICHPQDQGRSIAHPAVFCETVTWQWEELGDGNEAEFQNNGCPVPTVPKGNGQKRKSKALSSSQIPDK